MRSGRRLDRDPRVTFRHLCDAGHACGADAIRQSTANENPHAIRPLRRISPGRRRLPVAGRGGAAQRVAARRRLRPVPRLFRVQRRAAGRLPRLLQGDPFGRLDRDLRRDRDAALSAQQHQFCLDRREQWRQRLFGGCGERQLAVRPVRQFRHRGAGQCGAAAVRSHVVRRFRQPDGLAAAGALYLGGRPLHRAQRAAQQSLSGAMVGPRRRDQLDRGAQFVRLPGSARRRDRARRRGRRVRQHLPGRLEFAA